MAASSGSRSPAGVVDDLSSGRRFLPVGELDHIGDEILYVRPDAAGSLEPAPGGSTGAAGAIEDMKAKASDAAQAAGEKLGEVGAKVDEATNSEGEGARTSGSDLVGRRSGSDVTDADGRIIVANGQLISAEHVDRASEADRSDELRAAADAWSAAERERVISGTIEQVADTAGSVWDRFMTKISELTDETGKRMTEQQTKARLAAINDAVGRPVTKVILDRSDEVILNLGDIITHEAVQRAYDAGTLDTLLDSVYKGEVAFERDEMKAPTEGSSTVEKAAGGAAIVEELQGTVDSAESERAEAAEKKRREAEEAREQRETERQERAKARAEAADRAAAGEPLTADDGQDEARAGSTSSV